MSIVSCPRCGDKVSVPPAASASAMVQCPLCLEEYFLSDALIQLPPMLKVVGVHAAAGEKESDYRLAEPVAAAVGAAMFDAESAGVSTVSPRPQLKTVSRPRRQEKSPVGEIVKIVLGGVAGLAGGLLVLWWGFGVDVGDLGPRVSKVQYLRFLVPPKLWDRSVPSGKDSPTLDTLTAEPKSRASGGAGAPVAKESDDTASQGLHTDFGFGIDPGPVGTPRGKSAAKSGDDPFASLEELNGETKPASDPLELKIDDPLTIAPPETIDLPTKNAEPTPEAADDRETSEPQGKPPKKANGENEANPGEPATARSQDGDSSTNADESPAEKEKVESKAAEVDPAEDNSPEVNPKEQEAERTE